MTTDQRAAWRRALAAKAKGARRRRGKHRRQADIKPGMIRRQPPKGADR